MFPFAAASGPFSLRQGQALPFAWSTSIELAADGR